MVVFALIFPHFGRLLPLINVGSDAENAIFDALSSEQ
jgi:hypothetical protein